jgi:hypothetical protein
VSTKGVDMVLPSDYDKLVVARQIELGYIYDTILLAQLHDDSDELTQLRAWIHKRLACRAVAGAAPQ